MVLYFFHPVIPYPPAKSIAFKSSLLKVISFPLSDSPEKLEGEIVLSVDTAIREAGKVEGNWDAQKEVLLYVIHGMLHLISFDDHDEEDLIEMRRGEVECLRAIGIEPPVGLHDRDGEEA